MNALSIVSFAALVSCAAAGLHGVAFSGPAAHGAIVQGPSAHAGLVGPDGSHQSAIAHGGAVVADGHHGGVVSAAVAPGVVGYAHQAVPVVPVYAGVGYGHGGAGLEGQYVPSGLEKLYDDGSYKGEHHYAHDDYDHGYY